MSYFICLSVSNQCDVSHFFDRQIKVDEASHIPIGKSLIGSKKDETAYLVTINGSSTDLMDKGYYKTNCSILFKEGVKSLVQEEYIVSFIIHFFGSLVDTEEVKVQEKKLIALDEFYSSFPNMQEDIRYIVMNPV